MRLDPAIAEWIAKTVDTTAKAAAAKPAPAPQNADQRRPAAKRRRPSAVLDAARDAEPRCGLVRAKRRGP
ncbi:hypothetical protein [Streptomyces cyaneofuscatus]|uniref:hypothetical protein n=1 Tax=Streptomyces cyaneofuscatus TaxID=66883 RepID=UPI00364CCFB1